MPKKIFRDWLRSEIILNHNSYMCVANALKLIEERRQNPPVDNPDYLDQLSIIERALRKYPDDTSLLSVQFQEEQN